MDWKENALKILKDSLYPIPSELNELDWKSGLSDKTERLAQHLSAFANMKGGGILVYGVNNDGSCFDLNKELIDKIVQTLGNIAQNNFAFPISIEHAVMDFEGHPLLFVYIPEQVDKPEKVAACYQHACLMYEDGATINNQSVRQRFELSKNDSSIASRIISDTVEAGLIKPADNETVSKKYMTYIPYYG